MNIAIILAAGSGIRLNSNTPKQIIKINGKPLFSYSLDTFLKCEEIDKVVLVCSESTIEDIKSYCVSLPNVSFVLGSTSRFKSLQKAYEFLSPSLSGEDLLIIHDADRPNVSLEIIKDNIKEAKEFGAVITAIKSDDSVIEIDKSLEYKNRDQILQVQTPQSFKVNELKKFINDCDDYKDEGSAAIKHGINVKIVNGSSTNKKITTIDDLKLFEAYILMNK